MKHSRRQFLQFGGAAMLSFAGGPAQTDVTEEWPICRGVTNAAATETTGIGLFDGEPDHTIDIGVGVVELGKDVAVSTRLYNGQFPGPLLRFSEGKRVVIEMRNNTDTPEQLHWHGQYLPAEVDGAAEEGTPFIPPRGARRISFVPGPAGFRHYHTHVTAEADLSLGLYSGQVGPVYIEPRREPGAYDREVFLTLKEFAPYLNHMEMTTRFLAPQDRVRELYNIDQVSVQAARKQGHDPGFELAYNFFAVNGRMLGEGEPIRVKAGERVLFHILNASASEIRSLALPGHVFKVVALDGNPVPVPAEVPVLWIGGAERISAIVEMKKPGIWIMGDLDDDARSHGMGIVVEYPGRTGEAQWQRPAPFLWDYRRFAAPAAPGASPRPPDETIELLFGTQYSAHHGFDTFTINGTPFSMTKMEPKFRLRQGRRYRLWMRNATDDVHPLHLHRHGFELTSIAGHPTAGIIKDVAMIGGFQEMTVDFTADQRGLSLFHCHMQPHMDFGFMALFDCS
jgi:FtsP/CotA-like multicopper oxidase with cupredoxin domain